MAGRLARNKKSRVQPPSHHHILDPRVCRQVSHVRFLSVHVSYPNSAHMSHIHSQSLSSLFNTLPRHSALRFPVYNTLLNLASSNDELQVLQVFRSDVENWLKEWDITPTEKSAFLKTLVDVFSKAGQLYVSQLHFLPRCTYPTIHFFNRAETRPITTNSCTSAR
jgi:hypothetical protein